MSAIGTKQTFLGQRSMSAIGGKADIAWAYREARVSRKRNVLGEGHYTRLQWSTDFIRSAVTVFFLYGTSGNCVLAEPFLSHRFSDQRADAG